MGLFFFCDFDYDLKEWYEINEGGYTLWLLQEDSH